jgi:hypothetical protein
MTDVPTFLAGVTPERRHREAVELDAFFQRVTDWKPVLWRGGMLGYGTYDYTYASGRSGNFLATGFAPRKARLSIYVMPGYSDFGPILTRLGKHAKGKSCLYLNKLAEADMEVLEELIRAGLADLAKRWPVHPT